MFDLSPERSESGCHHSPVSALGVELFGRAARRPRELETEGVWCRASNMQYCEPDTKQHPRTTNAKGAQGP